MILGQKFNPNTTVDMTRYSISSRGYLRTNILIKLTHNIINQVIIYILIKYTDYDTLKINFLTKKDTIRTQDVEYCTQVSMDLGHKLRTYGTFSGFL